MAEAAPGGRWGELAAADEGVIVDDGLAKFVARQYDRIAASGTQQGPCPDANDWALLADDLLSPAARESLIDHLSRCPSCRRTAGKILSMWSGPEVTHRTWLRAAYALAACLLLAVGVYWTAVSWSPSTQSLLAQAAQKLELGDYHQARATLDRVLADAKAGQDERRRAQSLYEQVYVASARAKLERKEYAAAQVELDEAARRGYQSAEIIGLRGTAMLYTAVAMGPDPEDKLTALGFVGVLHRMTKSVPETLPAASADAAINLLREAAGREPASGPRWRELGKALLSVHRYAEAVEPFERWCRLAPTDAVAHNALGLALYAAERYPEAVVAFDKAIDLQPVTATYHFNAALACEGAGRLKDALAHWRRYLDLDPKGPQAEEVRNWLSILEQGIKQ